MGGFEWLIGPVLVGVFYLAGRARAIADAQGEDRRGRRTSALDGAPIVVLWLLGLPLLWWMLSAGAGRTLGGLTAILSLTVMLTMGALLRQASRVAPVVPSSKDLIDMAPHAIPSWPRWWPWVAVAGSMLVGLLTRWPLIPMAVWVTMIVMGWRVWRRSSLDLVARDEAARASLAAILGVSDTTMAAVSYRVDTSLIEVAPLPVPALARLAGGRPDFDHLVAQLLPDWEVLEASPARLALVPVTEATLAARRLAIASEGLVVAAPTAAADGGAIVDATTWGDETPTSELPQWPLASEGESGPGEDGAGPAVGSGVS